MNDTLSFNDETLDNALRRRTEYDDQNPGAMVLSVPKRAGGHINLPLIDTARSSVEQAEQQENTLLRIKPLAELTNNLPVQAGGLTFHTGRGVALLRPGYLYVFRGDAIWRELEIDTKGWMSDVDLQGVRRASDDSAQTGSPARISEGEWLSNILVPVLLQGRAVIDEIRVAYSEVQWSWRYIRHLEDDPAARRARTTGIDHAWPAATVDDLTFDMGYPASKITSVQGVRARDLGVELMLEDPADFRPEFEAPADQELCTRLKQRLEQIAGDDQRPLNMALNVGPGKDLLDGLRDQKGVVGVSIPDPLFQLRHSLSQLHLALHYLDAVDLSIKHKPMVHSAMLIRQAVFDPLALDGKTELQKYADAIDKDKLDEALDTREKDHAVAVIDRHLEQLQSLMKSRVLAAVLDDYRACRDLAICEGYLLIADQLNLLQQIPGVLRANGVACEHDLHKSLKRWLFDSDFLADWAPPPPDPDDTDPSNESESLHQRLRQLTDDSSEITGEMLDRLNLQSLAYLEKQLHDREEGASGIDKTLSDAGKVGSLVARSLEEWSTAVLKVCERLMEEGAVTQVEIQRVMISAASNFTMADPSLEGISIVSRGGVESSGTILGVRGNGLTRGLTQFDRTEGILTRKNDYLYADLMNGSDDMMGSTSPSRVVDDLDATVVKAAGPASVFYAPAGHAEAKKLGLLKVDWAQRLGKIVDGPAVSRGLVALAAFNVFVELRAAWAASSASDNHLKTFAKGSLGPAADLTAASLKLSIALNAHSVERARATATFRMATRPWFDVKGWWFIGSRLQNLGASTLVRTIGLANFAAGAIGAGLSYWDMRHCLSNKDFDAATGHALALTGGTVFLASPLMHTLLAIPGWGWAMLGMAMVVGGGIYAAHASDGLFEQLLKRGPWGVHSDESASALDDRDFYAQLITLMSPVSVTASKFSDVATDVALSHSDYPPAPDDYVVTVQIPIASSLRLAEENRSGLPPKTLRLVFQEVAYATSQVSGVVPAEAVTSTHLRSTTPLQKVVGRESLPNQSAVRFLVKRELRPNNYESFGYRESVSTALRVGLQAVIDTEAGPIVFPSPVLEDFQAFDLALHGTPPSKRRSFLSPYAQPKSPYWFFTEVAT